MDTPRPYSAKETGFLSEYAQIRKRSTFLGKPDSALPENDLEVFRWRNCPALNREDEAVSGSDSAARPALRARLLQPLRQSPAHRHVPDLPGIFADGAVGGEPRHPRDVENAGPRPCRDHLPARVDAALGLEIGGEIRTHHVVVEIA